MSSESRIRRNNDKLNAQAQKSVEELPVQRQRETAIVERLAQIEEELPTAFTDGTGHGAAPLMTERKALQTELKIVRSKIQTGLSSQKYLAWLTE